MAITHAFVNLHPDGPDATLTRPSDWNAVHIGTATPALHNVLDSVYHSDVLTGAITRGDLLHGNATPKIARLALGGISGSIVTRDATDVLWSTYALAGTAAQTYTFPAVSGGVALGAGTLTNATVNDATIANHTHAVTGSFPASAHDILSASHGDTLAAAVLDGSIIVGNVTPKWSALAISVPAANVRNVLGIDNAELRPSWKAALDATNPTTIAAGAIAAPGTSLIFSHRDHTHGSPATWAATAHNVLDSTYHGDVLTGAITRGDVLYGNATPKIARLALGGISGSVVTRNATDVLWSTGALSFGGAFTLTISANASIGGTAITGTPGTCAVATVNAAADPHTHAITSVNVATAADNILACDAAGGLQLTKLGVGMAYSATNPVNIVQSFTDAAGAENRGLTSALNIYRTGAGSSGVCPAFQFQCQYNSAFNEAGALLGVDGKVINVTANSLAYAYGARMAVINNGAGSITVAHGVDITANASAGKIVEWEGVYCTSTIGTIDYARGIYIGTITGTFQSYAIYSAAAGSYSWHAGNWAIGGAARIPTVTLDTVLNNATTNAVNEVARITHNSTGTAAAGFGSALDFYLESSTTADTQAARISVLWNEATHASRKADLVASAWDTAEREGIRIRADGARALVGIATAVPTARLHLPAGSATANTAPLKFVSGALLATPEAGVMEFYDGRWYITGTAKQRVIDRTSQNVNVANVTVSNTVVETALYTWTLSANAMKVGRIYKIHFNGIISTASASDDITFNFYMGATLYATFKPAMGSITNKVWFGDYHITIRTTGAGGTSAMYRTFSVNTITSETASLLAVDTTVANAITLKVKWDNAKAGNTITLYQAFLELKN